MQIFLRTKKLRFYLIIFFNNIILEMIEFEWTMHLGSMQLKRCDAELKCRFWFLPTHPPALLADLAAPSFPLVVSALLLSTGNVKSALRSQSALLSRGQQCGQLWDQRPLPGVTAARGYLPWPCEKNFNRKPRPCCPSFCNTECQPGEARSQPAVSPASPSEM